MEALANCDNVALPALSSLFLRLLDCYSHCSELAVARAAQTCLRNSELQVLEMLANALLLQSYDPIQSKTMIILTASEGVTFMGRRQREKEHVKRDRISEIPLYF